MAAIATPTSVLTVHRCAAAPMLISPPGALSARTLASPPGCHKGSPDGSGRRRVGFRDRIGWDAADDGRGRADRDGGVPAPGGEGAGADARAGGRCAVSRYVDEPAVFHWD